MAETVELESEGNVSSEVTEDGLVEKVESLKIQVKENEREHRNEVRSLHKAFLDLHAEKEASEKAHSNEVHGLRAMMDEKKIEHNREIETYQKKVQNLTELVGQLKLESSKGHLDEESRSLMVRYLRRTNPKGVVYSYKKYSKKSKNKTSQRCKVISKDVSACWMLKASMEVLRLKCSRQAQKLGELKADVKKGRHYTLKFYQNKELLMKMVRTAG